MSISRLLGRLFGGQEAAPVNNRAPVAPPAATPPAFNYDDDRIPQSAKAKALNILTSIEAVEKAMVREQVQSLSRVDTAQMREVHLPQLIQSRPEELGGGKEVSGTGISGGGLNQ